MPGSATELNPVHGTNNGKNKETKKHIVTFAQQGDERSSSVNAHWKPAHTRVQRPTPAMFLRLVSRYLVT